MVASTLVWAGGGQQTQPAAPATPAAAAEPVTLRVWGGVPEENGPGDLIRAFEAANPNIKVEYTRFVNDDQGNLRLDTALVAGGQVDVYFTYRNDNLVRRASSGNALALDSIATADGMNLAQAFGDLTYATVNGGVYAIPTNKGPQFFMVNKDMFDAAGIPLPTSWTAADYRRIANQLSSGTGQDRIYGVMYPNWPQLFLLGAQSALGPNGFLKADGTSNFTDPLFREFIELRRTMQYDDRSEVPYVEVVSQNLSDATEFLTEQVAMIYTGTWRVRSVRDLETFPHDFKTAFVPLFTMKPGQTRTYNEGSLGDWAMIARDTKVADAAWKFIRYWATEGSDPMVAKGGKIPAWTEYPAAKVTEVMLGPDADKLFDIESFERVVLNAPLFSYQPTDPVAVTIYNDMRNVVKEEVELLYVGRQNLDQTIQAIDRRVNTLARSAR